MNEENTNINNETSDNKAYIDNKKRYLIIFVAIGLFLIVVTNIGTLFIPKFAADDFWPEILNIWGLILIVPSLVEFYLKIRPEWNKRNRIVEYDERNILIRGKAAYATYVLSVVLLAIIGTVLIYLDYIFPAYLVTALMFVEFLALLFFTKYYGTKL
ncbi:MAG: DUF2178 domain-containing protein [Methanobacteriaceae archaeon]|jgi:uncharacterized membrane protein|nr:DUF2178 domain-containing protein [Candidatus Methanorudis spinitermitis]